MSAGLDCAPISLCPKKENVVMLKQMLFTRVLRCLFLFLQHRDLYQRLPVTKWTLVIQSYSVLSVGDNSGSALKLLASLRYLLNLQGQSDKCWNRRGWLLFNWFVILPHAKGRPRHKGNVIMLNDGWRWREREENTQVHSFTFRACSRHFYPKQLTISTFFIRSETIYLHRYSKEVHRTKCQY